MMRSALLFSLSFFLFVADGFAQAASGTVFLTNWPPALQAAVPPGADDDTRYPYDVLPFLDTLALSYTYGVEAAAPAMDFTLAWVPGAYGVYDNRLVEASALPEDLRLVDLTLRADVVSEGEAVALLRLVLEDLALPPAPAAYDFQLDAPTWGTLFEATSAAGARALFDVGFTLENLYIERVGFATYVPQEAEVIFVPRYIPPRVGIWIDEPYPPASGKRARGAKPKKPREGIGRRLPRPTKEKQAETDDARDDGEARPARRSTKSNEPDRDDEDDDTELLPAALAGLAMVGALAYAGGTIGVYGHPEAPFGLTSGLVRRRGGVLAQLAANEGVFGADEPERLVGKVMVFYGVLRAPVQPAFGLGVVATEAGDAVTWAPSFSAGAVLNLDQFFFYGGYDFEARGIELSLAFNFRRLR